MIGFGVQHIEQVGYITKCFVSFLLIWKPSLAWGKCTMVCWFSQRGKSNVMGLWDSCVSHQYCIFYFAFPLQMKESVNLMLLREF